MRSNELLEAARAGELERVKALVEQDTSIDKDNALRWAAREGRLDVVRFLVEHGAVIDATDYLGDTVLTRAAEGGHTKIVRFLTEDCKLDVNTSNMNGITALMRAATNGQVEVVRYLAGQRGVQMGANDKYGYTALMKACKAGHVDIVRCLAEAGADVKDTDEFGHTTLMIASGSGNLEVVRYLVEDGGVAADSRSMRGETAIRLAVAAGYHDIEQYLKPLLLTFLMDDVGGDVAGDAKVSEMDSSKLLTNSNMGPTESLRLESVPQLAATMQRLLTRLRDESEDDEFTRVLVRFVSLWSRLEQIFWQINGAVSDEHSTQFCSLVADAKRATFKLQNIQGRSNLEAVTTQCCCAFELLLDKCVDAISGENDGDLMWAARHGRIDIVRALCEVGTAVDAQAKDGRTPLMIAAENNEIQLIKYLIERGASITTTDSVRNTVLMIAAEKGRKEVCQYLVKLSGCDVNAKNSFGHTALIRAAANGHINVVRLLVDQGADANAASKQGLTALMMATLSGSSDIVRFLADKHKADINAKTTDGDTVLMLAASGGHTDAFLYFTEERGLDLNAKNDNGDTALMRAAANGKVAIVRYITDHGVQLNAKNKRGYTALMKATKSGHAEVAQCLLEQSGIDVNHRNERGETAARLAADHGHLDIERMLTPFLPPRREQDTAAITCSSAFSSYIIPPSEVDLVQFCRNENVGGEYLAEWLDADAVVKLNILDASHTPFKDEVCLWQQLRHPNVMKMYGACFASPNLQFFVCEYVSNGSLLDCVELASLKRPTMWKFLHEAALGLEYLHERGIVHGDLQCRNILIGSDGLAKLTNFGLSGSTKRPGREFSVGAKRWQSPEVLQGKSASTASDIYSLGMCILEAVTRERPWGCQTEHTMEKHKMRWNPETEANSFSEPDCFPGEARRLVWRMCCQDPGQRAPLASIIYELERLAITNSLSTSQPECEREVDTNRMQNIEVDELWLDVTEFMDISDEDQYCRSFDALKRLRLALKNSTTRLRLLEEFKTLLTDFYRIITMSPEQASMLRASSTWGTITNMNIFHLRIESVLGSLEKSQGEERERNLRWQHQRNEQAGVFLSEVQDTSHLLDRLTTAEERAAYLKFLRTEMKDPRLKYSAEQLAVMKKAYTEIASTIENDDISQLIPEWFIPRFELIVDEWRCLGSGGFGSVYQAKWLDSEVVAKLLGSAADMFAPTDQSSESSLSALLDLSSTQSTMDSTKRCEAMSTFRHEVDIWFGFNHPHIIRLFGACHVGTPFFVCEYATNGTLTSYLQKHPNELWTKLHEAALGVQYLHARGVVHGDLKGNNIVIGSDMKAKVTDFGLSSMANNDEIPQISGAWHWVAPECLPDINDGAQNSANKRPTVSSDVYSLGMCIIEALRVVENVEDVKRGKLPQPTLPWGKLDNFLVRYHATKGKFPSKPTICSDDQWEFIKKVCAFSPQERIRISTVVDRLSQITTRQQNEFKDASQMKQMNSNFTRETITAARNLLNSLPDNMERRESLPALYASLWNRLEQVHESVDNIHESECQNAFYSLMQEVNEGTRMLQNMNNSLVNLAETTMRYYALNRRLDKFCDAYFRLFKQGSQPAAAPCENYFARFMTLLAGVSISLRQSSGGKVYSYAMKLLYLNIVLVQIAFVLVLLACWVAFK